MSASKTYIQMWLKRYELGYWPLAKPLLGELRTNNDYLKKHPEAIEFVVRRRIEFTKIYHRIGLGKIMELQYLLVEADAIIDFQKIQKGWPIIQNKKWLVD